MSRILLTVRVEPEIKQWLEKKSLRDRVTVSRLVENQLRGAMNRSRAQQARMMRDFECPARTAG